MLLTFGVRCSVKVYIMGKEDTGDDYSVMRVAEMCLVSGGCVEYVSIHFEDHVWVWSLLALPFPL